MIFDEKKITVAYRCPECGTVVRSMVGAFSLSADMLRLNCPCKESSLTIVYTRDKKLRITVPCFICPNPHSFTISEDMFFKREIFTYSCPYSGINVCFIGSEESVISAVEQSEKELLDMLGENTLYDISSRRENEFMTDPMIRDIVSFMIQELAEEGGIRCKCVDGEGEYEAEVLDEEIVVRCTKCGSSTHVAANSFTAANDFLKVDFLDLK